MQHRSTIWADDQWFMFEKELCKLCGKPTTTLALEDMPLTESPA